MDYPNITVVIPTLDRATGVINAIESLKNQTYKGKILCVVVDSSTDTKTKESINNLDFENTELEVKYIKNNNSRRAIDNWILGIEEFNSEYGKFLCDDDWLHPEYIEKCINVFDIKNVDCVISNISIVKQDGLNIRNYYEVVEGKVSKEEVIDSFLGLKKILPVTPTASLMKSEILKNSFYESLKHIECTEKLFGFDFFMSYFPVFNGNGSYIINESLVFSYAGSDSMTLNVKKAKIAYCYFFALINLIESNDCKINKNQQEIISHKMATFNIRSLLFKEYREFNYENSFQSKLKIKKLLFSQLKKYLIKVRYSQFITKQFNKK